MFKAYKSEMGDLSERLHKLYIDETFILLLLGNH